MRASALRIVWAITWRALAILFWLVLIEACCRFCKPPIRSPIEIVHYPAECLEGPPPTLAALARTTTAEGCPVGHVCYGPSDTLILARWIEEIAEWSRDALTLCGIKEDDDDKTNNSH